MATSVSYRRSCIRAYVLDVLLDRGDSEPSEYDVEGIVTEILEMGDTEFRDMTHADFTELSARHPATPEPTDEELAAAIQRSQTGWVVMLKTTHGEVELVVLHNPSLKTEGMVRAHMTKFVGPLVDMQIFRQVG